jgi:heme-degrading monooxygenase HmoA
MHAEIYANRSFNPGDTALIIEVIRYAVASGEEAAFEEAQRQAGVLLEKSSHCLGFTLTRATRHRNNYLMTVYWDSPDGHLIGFRQSESFAEYQTLLQPYAAMIEDASHYRKTGIELTKKQLVRISGPPR